MKEEKRMNTQAVIQKPSGIGVYCACLVILFALCSVRLSGQDARLNVIMTTVTYNGTYAPRNSGAIWIEDATGKFVKTVQLWAAARRNYLTNWMASSAGNTVDAVTSATLTTHQQHNVTWNGTDVNRTSVPAGDYRVRFEFTESNATGRTHTLGFTSGTTSQTITPVNATNFINMQLIFTVSTASPDPTPDPTPVTTPIVTSAPTIVPTAAATSAPGGILGDVNGSGVVDIVDALLIAQYYVGTVLPVFNAAVADVNCSGTADIVDSLLVAQYYVGLIAQLPCAAPTPDTSLVTLYVATTGNDANAGTEAAPFRTIQKGCDSLAAGKMLCIRVGTYNEKVTVRVSGNARNFITIRNFGADKVIVSGAGLSAKHVFDLGNASFVRIMGLDVRNNTSTDGCGIYINAGKNTGVENNFIHDCGIGIGIDATAAGTTASGIVVLNNAIYNNAKAAMSIGGATYSANGKAVNCHIMNNTCYGNDTTASGQGELTIRWAENNVVRSNIFYCTSQNLLLSSQTQGNVFNSLDFNLWYADSGIGSARFIWNGTSYTGYAAYLSASTQDKNSGFARPLFVNASVASPDFKSLAGSPSIDTGDPAFAPYGIDLGGNPRANGLRVDVGAYEY